MFHITPVLFSILCIHLFCEEHLHNRFVFSLSINVFIYLIFLVMEINSDGVGEEMDRKSTVDGFPSIQESQGLNMRHFWGQK